MLYLCGGYHWTLRKTKRKINTAMSHASPEMSKISHQLCDITPMGVIKQDIIDRFCWRFAPTFKMCTLLVGKQPFPNWSIWHQISKLCILIGYWITDPHLPYIKFNAFQLVETLQKLSGFSRNVSGNLCTFNQRWTVILYRNTCVFAFNLDMSMSSAFYWCAVK